MDSSKIAQIGFPPASKQTSLKLPSLGMPGGGKAGKAPSGSMSTSPAGKSPYQIPNMPPPTPSVPNMPKDTPKLTQQKLASFTDELIKISVMNTPTMEGRE